MSSNKEKKKAVDKGFEQLLGVHTAALEDNSRSVIEILQILAEKELSAKDKSSLKQINKELRSIDRKIDSLGKAPKFEEEKEKDWFEF